MFIFDNSYARLPAHFYTKMPATPVRAPAWIALNDDLAHALGADPQTLRQHLDVFAGNTTPEGADPLAQLYAGHQFAGWSPQLGDGRALLLGEVIDTKGHRRDIQLKGSGPTPYSRNGDGRAAIGPVIREYLVSEAMHALGVPTTRALAAVTTGETVLRQEGPLPGAILTRVAASHIRVGTFQVFAARQDKDALQKLLTHTLARHAPDHEGPLGLLHHAIQVQATLIAKWMGLGFIHGVMNTDNMTLSGETIDYGPCAFMEGFDPAQVFSSIDQFGRYAYHNQPDIALWNLSQLANALLLLWDDQDQGVSELTQALNAFAPKFHQAWAETLSAKIGLAPEHVKLGEDLLKLMAQDKADFTNTFRALGTPEARDQFVDRDAFDTWQTTWQRHGPDLSQMAQTNPVIIPRNHRVQEAITAAERGNYAPFKTLHHLLKAPFTATDENAPYRRPAEAHEAVTRTFCGT